MISAPIRRLTVDEYHRIAEAGVLHENDRVELLNGQLIDMLPIGPFHGGSVNFLNLAFTALARGRWITSVQNSIYLGKHSEPQPDLVLLRPEPNYYRDRLAEAGDVFLLVEVADSTLVFDREEKLPVYARAGVAEVWLLNVPQRIVEVYREPKNGEYSLCRKVRAGDPLAPTAFPDAEIDTDGLLA